MNWSRRNTAIALCGAVFTMLAGHAGRTVLAEQDKSDQQTPIAEAQTLNTTANRYDLEPVSLLANGPLEESRNNKLIRIRGAAPDGGGRQFEVFFGPSPSENAAKMAGKGRFTNTDPTWECIQGYALMRGIRPSGSTQYVKATSDSTTIIMLVNRATGHDRIIVTEAKDGAKVWLRGGAAPEAPNVMQGQVIIATIVDGVATLGAPMNIDDDPVSRELLTYLGTIKGARDVGIGR